MYDARQISSAALLLSAAYAAPLCAQEPTAPAPAEPMPVTEQSAPVADDSTELSAGELRIRTGIMLLVKLHDTMAGIQNRDSAEVAVPTIMQLSRELQSWGQGFAALPPLDEDTQSSYEKRYLPIINKLNERIQIQADRIAAAEFYGSENLPAALVKLVNSVQ